MLEKILKSIYLLYKRYTIEVRSRELQISSYKLSIHKLEKKSFQMKFLMLVNSTINIFMRTMR